MAGVKAILSPMAMLTFANPRAYNRRDLWKRTEIGRGRLNLTLKEALHNRYRFVLHHDLFLPRLDFVLLKGITRPRSSGTSGKGVLR